MEEKIIQIMQENFKEINERFKEINERFDEVNERFDEVNKRLDEHDEKFEGINNYLVVMEHEILDKISALFSGYDSNHEQLQILKQRVDELEEKESFNSIKISILDDKLG